MIDPMSDEDYEWFNFYRSKKGNSSMRLLPCLVFFTTALSVAISQESTKNVMLFDGKTLQGWDGNEKVWRVKDGVIVGGSFENNPKNEFLTYKSSFKNFILELDYKLVCKDGDPNAGIQFRSKRIENPPNEMFGFQADIGSYKKGNLISGSLYDESRRKKFLVQSDPKLVKEIEKLEDWNTYKIHANGNKIELYLNGKKTCDYTETDATIETSGFIGLQIHGNSKAEVYYRNIKIQELP